MFASHPVHYFKWIFLFVHILERLPIINTSESRSFIKGEHEKFLKNCQLLFDGIIFGQRTFFSIIKLVLFYRYFQRWCISLAESVKHWHWHHCSQKICLFKFRWKVRLKWKKKVSFIITTLLNIPQYAWMCPYKQGSENAWGPKYASLTQHSEYILGSKYASILNMVGCWIWKSYTGFYICHNMAECLSRTWTCLNVWIYDNRQGSEYVSYNT